MLYHTSIDAMLETNFSLMQHHKWSLSEVEGMIPWEKEVYISLLLDHLKEQEMQRKSEESRRR